MIEVFATNITSEGKAKRILTQIEEIFPAYIANFDLEDCDKILRIETLEAIIDTKSIIRLVTEMNGQASLL
ncbi:hypothetical protein AWW67_10085 [Roseivirga seohaensis]|uniref:Uncharacterized protein n=1 Tax=Roseivirga seohaensis TaxID=1914963 RepID=A0A150XLQ4_9BACT|nr:hypothetical protein [Roseivirga seohaensis]KYG79668.1 hypothetical protein AWW67_10085 [Roseivirga seohaensis]